MSMPSPSLTGLLHKMPNRDSDPVRYQFWCGDQKAELQSSLGKKIRMEFSGEIFCLHCGRKTKRSFHQGHCFSCFQTLAACDLCIMKPELCQWEAGRCREPQWGLDNCMIPHTVYLANTSGLKVGITRSHQQETRWRDQGAIQAIPLSRVSSRYLSGLAEAAFRNYLSDRTQWQRMLKNQTEELDMVALRREYLEKWPQNIPHQLLPEETVYRFHYPVLEYPSKVKSLNPEKQPVVEGTLLGIKGQYLILDTGVINIRKYGGYECKVYLPETAPF